MTAWIWLLIGLWAGMGIGMAAPAFIFLPTSQQQVYRDVKAPQKMLAEWL